MLINPHNIPLWDALLSHFSDEITEARVTSPRLHNLEAAELGLTKPGVPKLKPVHSPAGPERLTWHLQLGLEFEGRGPNPRQSRPSTP